MFIFRLQGDKSQGPKRNRKRPSDTPVIPEPKRLQVTAPQEMKPLETFYYGTLEGDKSLIEKETKAPIDTRVSVNICTARCYSFTVLTNCEVILAV